MKEFNASSPTEQLMVARSLILVAKSTSGAFDKFVIWMLTAFAAGLTYLIGQKGTDLDGLKIAGTIYIGAAFFGVIQRYMAMLVTNCAKVSKEAEKAIPGTTNIDLARFLIIYIGSLSGFQQFAAAWAARKVMSGDLVATGRALMRLAFWQCILGLACAALLLWAAFFAIESF